MSLICIVVVMLTAIVPVSASISCEQVHYPMYFNGTLVPEGDKPILSLNWNTYVPLRKVCEGTGLEVVWNNEKQEIYVENKALYAAQDYATLSKIYDLTYDVWEKANSFSSAYSDALTAVLTNDHESWDVFSETLDLDIQSIGTNMDSIKLLAGKLHGYYDGTTVTDKMYTAIETQYNSCISIYLACTDAYNTIIKYKSGLLSYYDALNAYQNLTNTRKNVMYDFAFVSSISYSIILHVGQYQDYNYLDYQSIKPNILK